MMIVCSWCRVEGHTGVVGEKAPLDDRRETHGICPAHRLAVQARWRQVTLATEAMEGATGAVSSDTRRSADSGRAPNRVSTRWWSDLTGLTRRSRS